MVLLALLGPLRCLVETGPGVLCPAQNALFAGFPQSTLQRHAWSSGNTLGFLAGALFLQTMILETISLSLAIKPNSQDTKWKSTALISRQNPPGCEGRWCHCTWPMHQRHWNSGGPTISTIVSELQSCEVNKQTRQTVLCVQSWTRGPLR